MSRASLGLAVLVSLSAACGSSTTSSSTDLGQRDLSSTTSKEDMAMSMTGDQDLATPLIGSCVDLDTYCGAAGTYCVRTWAKAQDPAEWCKPGKDPVDIYFPTGTCTGNYRMVQLGGPKFLDNKQLFYSMDGDGALVAVVSVGEFSTYLCDAGDMSYATLMYNGCTLGPSKMCVNGQIIN